jgi:hypothetical protein
MRSAVVLVLGVRLVAVQTLKSASLGRQLVWLLTVLPGF